MRFEVSVTDSAIPRGALICAVVLAIASPAEAQPRPDIVIVRDSGVVTGCEALGEVRASSLLGGALTNMAYSRVLNSIKKRARDMGATHVVLVDSSSGFAGSNMLGQAYRCTPKASVEPSAR
jgi:hypothetical protein